MVLTPVLVYELRYLYGTRKSQWRFDSEFRTVREQLICRSQDLAPGHKPRVLDMIYLKSVPFGRKVMRFVHHGYRSLP